MEQKRLKERLEGMTLLQKIEYIWMYEKVWLGAFAGIIGAIWIGYTMYQGIATPVLLNIVITGGDTGKAEELKEEFCTYAGIDEDDGIVRIKANVPEDGGSVNSETALTTLIGADAVDVLVCNEALYQEYEAQGGFVEGKSVNLGADNYLTRSGIISYEDAHAAILVNGKNEEIAEVFVCFLLTNTGKNSKI